MAGWPGRTLLVAGSSPVPPASWAPHSCAGWPGRLVGRRAGPPTGRRAARRRHRPVIPDDVDGLIALVGELAPSHCFHLATAFRGVHTPADIAPMIEANLGFGTALAEAAARVPASGS